jgi:hypothetical protein
MIYVNNYLTDYVSKNLIGILSGSSRGRRIGDATEVRIDVGASYKVGILVITIKNQISKRAR